jgi:O-antigen biosynthesis protein
MPSPPELARRQEPGALDGRTPLLPAIIDLSEPLPALGGAAGAPYRLARCLVVAQGSPIGWVRISLDPAGTPPARVADAIWSSLRREIVAELAGRGLSAPGSLPVEGFDLGHRGAQRVEDDAAVVIATRERPEQLEACLRSVLGGLVVPRQLLVVDNAPVTDHTRMLVERMARQHPSIGYIREDRAGLGRAHNAAIPHLETRLVAFTDDDVVVHPWWLARIVDAFGAGDDVRCVTGMIAPLELDTPTQQLIEAHAGFNKGFSRRIFDPAQDHRDDPLFPYAAGAFGSGANMSFDTAYLRDVGGFDAALGAGTIALGGDDLAAFYDVITHGHQLVYEPGAVVSHRHHRDLEALQRQAYGYGAGLSAHLTRCVLNDPRTAVRMLRRLAPAARRAVSIASPERGTAVPAPPRSLTLHHVRGMAAGPVRYIRSRRAERSGGPGTNRVVGAQT